MSKNCILIGGSGFLGLNLARGLLKEGCNVTIADLKPPSAPGFADIIKDINFYLADYRDTNKSKDILKHQDTLFYLACSSLPGSPVLNIEDDIRNNVLEPIKLFRSAAESGIRLILFPSSGGTVYGDYEASPISETASTNPICSYGMTKLMVEKYLFFFNKMLGMDYLIFRMSNLYGPGQTPNAKQGIIANVIERLLSGKSVTVFGEGENVRDYLYVEDAVQAFISGLSCGLRNDVFNISSGKGHSVNEVIRIISKTIGTEPRIIYSDKRPFDVKSNVLDSGKFISATGWRARTPIEIGVESSHQWIKTFFNKQ